MIDKQIFAQVIAALAASLNGCPKEKADALYKILSSKMTTDEFRKAASSLLDDFEPTSAKPFPVPADFIKRGKMPVEERAARLIPAVRKLYWKLDRQSIVLNDKALQETINICGGCNVMCEPEWWNYNRRFFIETYCRLYGQELDPSPLVGLEPGPIKMLSVERIVGMNPPEETLSLAQRHNGGYISEHG